MQISPETQRDPRGPNEVYLGVGACYSGPMEQVIAALFVEIAAQHIATRFEHEARERVEARQTKLMEASNVF